MTAIDLCSLLNHVLDGKWFFVPGLNMIVLVVD